MLKKSHNIINYVLILISNTTNMKIYLKMLIKIIKQSHYI